MANYKRRAVVVTGATGSIGQAIMTDLYANAKNYGVTDIVACCRTPERIDIYKTNLAAMHQPTGVRVLAVRFGLDTNTEARQSANRVADLLQSEGIELAGIINNAGTMPISALQIAPSGLEMTLQVNTVGTLVFTRQLLPHVAAGGVVVFTSSIMRKLVTTGQDFAPRALTATTWAGRFLNYARSKDLLTLAATQMASTLVQRGIRVNCADPGVVDSGIIHLGYKWVDTLADAVARPLMRRPAQGAAAALRAYTTPMTAQMATLGSVKPLPPLTAADYQLLCALQPLEMMP